MSKNKLPEWNIFRKLLEREENIVACFDLLMTRDRIARCNSRKELQSLGKSLKELTSKATEEIISKSKTETIGNSWLRTVKFPQDYSKCIEVTLIQDTLVIVFDIQKAIRREIINIDISISTFLQFIFKSVESIFETLIENGYLVRGSVASGSLYYTKSQVLGEAFINAYNSIEGPQRLPLIAVEICSSIMRYQNWIFNNGMEHTHCSTGEYILHSWYLPYDQRVFLDPVIPDYLSIEKYLAMLQINGCNEKFLIRTADILIESHKKNSKEPFDRKLESVVENMKYQDWSDQKDEVISEFRLFRTRKNS